jgi:hypothetical protein
MEAPLIPLKWLLVEAGSSSGWCAYSGAYVFSLDVRRQLPIVTGSRRAAVMVYVIAEPCIGVKDTADAVKRRIAVTSTPFSPAPRYSRHARLDD